MTRLQFITTLLLAIPGVGWLRKFRENKVYGTSPGSNEVPSFRPLKEEDLPKQIREYPLTPDECFTGKPNDISQDEKGLLPKNLIDWKDVGVKVGENIYPLS